MTYNPLTNKYDQLSQKCMQCRKYLFGDEEVVDDPAYEGCLSHAHCVIGFHENDIDPNMIKSADQNTTNISDDASQPDDSTNKFLQPDDNNTNISDDAFQPDDNPQKQVPLKYLIPINADKKV